MSRTVKEKVEDLLRDRESNETIQSHFDKRNEEIYKKLMGKIKPSKEEHKKEEE